MSPEKEKPPSIILLPDHVLMAFNINTYFEKEIDERTIQQGFKFEMERLGIDLSWKSSQIEGNTYSLL